MPPWSTSRNCKVGRTSWSSSCRIQHNRERGVSKLGDGKRAIHDWWGCFQQFLSWACPSHHYTWEWRNCWGDFLWAKPWGSFGRVLWSAGDLDLDKLLKHAKTSDEPSLEDPLEERFAQFECNLDLDKFLEQAKIFNEPSLEDPLKECFAQFEFDLDLDMIHEQARPYWIPILRCGLRMEKPMRYPSLTHLHQQLSFSSLITRRKRKRST